MPSEPVARLPLRIPAEIGTKSAVADDTDNLSSRIHLFDQIRYNFVSPQFVRRPATRNDQAIQIVTLQRIDGYIRGDFKSILSDNRIKAYSCPNNFSTFFLQSHKWHVEF